MGGGWQAGGGKGSRGEVMKACLDRWELYLTNIRAPRKEAGTGPGELAWPTRSIRCGPVRKLESTWGFERREFNLGNGLNRYYWRKQGKKGALWEHRDGNCRKWTPRGPLVRGCSQEPPAFRLSGTP